MTKQSKKNERNQKFIEFYNEISETEVFLGLKTHKRVKYLAEEFKERNKIDIPIGTIYKLIRKNNSNTVSNETHEGESEVISTAQE